MPEVVTCEVLGMRGEVLPGFSWPLPRTDADYRHLAKFTLRTTHPNLPEAYAVRFRISDKVLAFWSHASEAADDNND